MSARSSRRPADALYRLIARFPEAWAAYPNGEVFGDT